jgi:hypothetical protein
MSGRMTVFFVERTGHVLGAVTRTSGASPDSQKGPIQEDVLVGIPGEEASGVGIGFPQFAVPGKHLSRLAVDPVGMLLLQPSYFHAPKAKDAQGIEQRPNGVEQLPELKVNAELLSTAPVIRIHLTTPAAKGGEQVWIMITGGALPEPLFIEPVFDENKDLVDFPIPALAGQAHQVLVLVEKRLPFAAIDTPHRPGP